MLRAGKSELTNATVELGKEREVPPVGIIRASAPLGIAAAFSAVSSIGAHVKQHAVQVFVFSSRARRR